MNKDFSIRSYNDDDYKFFDDAQFEMYKFEMWRDKEGTEEEIRKAYQEFIISDPLDHTGENHQVYIVENKAGTPIGLIWIALRDPFWKYDKPICWVYNLFINPEYRKMGIASSLLKRTESWAKERGSMTIGLHVADFNHNAIKLYSKMGYQLVHTHNWSCFYDKSISNQLKAKNGINKV